jgi:hypothetical protein
MRNDVARSGFWEAIAVRRAGAQANLSPKTCRRSAPPCYCLPMSRGELAIQLIKIALAVAVGAYFVWWSLEVLHRLPLH